MVLPFMSSKPKTEEYPAFTNFTIKVDVESSWTKTVTKILSSVKGVTNFRMDNNGKINISGYIDPTLLLNCLQKAGKTAQVVHWQYGECSSNLFEKTEPPSVNKGYYIYPEGYGGYNGLGYGYPYPSYARSNYALNHLECSGNASDCSGHHIQKPKKSSSSSSQFQKLASGGDHPTCCSLM